MKTIHIDIQKAYKALQKDEKAFTRRITSHLKKEAVRLEKEVGAYYAKYGVNNVIEYRTLKQALPLAEKELLMRRTEAFIAKYPQYAHLAPTRNSIYMLDRLEGLQASVTMEQMELGALTNEQLAAHLTKQAERGLDTSYRALGERARAHALNKEVVKKFVNANWAKGVDYSSRIWANTDEVARLVNTKLAQGFARGDSYKRLVQEMRGYVVERNRNNIYRVVYTEGSYVMNEAAMTPFQEAGYEYYILSPLPDACPECWEIHDEMADDAEHSTAQTYSIAQRQASVNFPPIHPWCRCSFEIVVNDVKPIRAQEPERERARKKQ